MKYKTVHITQVVNGFVVVVLDYTGKQEDLVFDTWTKVEGFLNPTKHENKVVSIK